MDGLIWTDSRRPGRIYTVNVTDASTQTTTQCEAEYGPCSRSSQDPPKPPLLLNDTAHAVLCVPDPPADPASAALSDRDDDLFSFFFDAYGGIHNYSVQISRGGRTGSTGLINSDVYGGALRYQCGGSGFCSSFIGSGTIVRAPFNEG